MVISQKDGEWKSVRLGDYSQVFRGGSPRPIQNYLTNSSQGINWIKIGDTGKDEKYITNTVERIIPEGISKSREVFVGDLLLSNSMSFGRPYILEINGCIHDGWLVIQDYQNSFDTQYLYYSLQTDSVKLQFNNLAAGSGVHNLNKEIVSNIILNKPNKDEQVAIATVLSEIDSLIDNLEKLIEKKKNIKQGAMQELLTGKRRLPGFTGGWTVKTIGRSGYLYKETINPQLSPLVLFYEYSMPAFDNGKQPIMKYGKDMHSNRIVISGKVLLFNKLNVRQKRIWLIDAEKEKSVCSSEFLAYYSDEIDLLYLNYLLNSSKITKNFIDSSTGTSNSQQRITPDVFLGYSITVPSDIEEQTAIASILSDMDNEIEELEKKLAKYRCIKQGMMSELLTGHIRLTEKEDA